jgi:hypothetical protein
MTIKSYSKCTPDPSLNFPLVILPSESSCSICLDNLCEGDNTLTIPKCGHSSHEKCDKIWRTTPKPGHADLPAAQREKTCPLCRGSIKKVNIYKRMKASNMFLLHKMQTRSTIPTVASQQPNPLDQVLARQGRRISELPPASRSLDIATGSGTFRDPSIHVNISTFQNELERHEAERAQETAAAIGFAGITLLAIISLFSTLRHTNSGAGTPS